MRQRHKERLTFLAFTDVLLQKASDLKPVLAQDFGREVFSPSGAKNLRGCVIVDAVTRSEVHGAVPGAVVQCVELKG